MPEGVSRPEDETHREAEPLAESSAALDEAKTPSERTPRPYIGIRRRGPAPYSGFESRRPPGGHAGNGVEPRHECAHVVSMLMERTWAFFYFQIGGMDYAAF